MSVTRYVWSGAVGTNDGSSWTDAFASISNALTGASPTDVIAVASDHNRSDPFSVTYSGPTSPGLQIISVNRTTNTYEPGAEEAITGTVVMNFQRFAHFRGVTFRGSASTGSSTANINIGNSQVTHGLVFEDCLFDSRSTMAVTGILIGPVANANNQEVDIQFVGTSFRWLNNTTGTRLRLQQGRITFIGCALGAGAGTVANLISARNGVCSEVTFIGCNWSGSTWTNLVEPLAGSHEYRFHDCMLRDDWNLLSSTPNPGGVTVTLTDCRTESGTQIPYQYHDALGSLVLDTAQRRTASPANAAWVITTTANATPFQPFRSPWISTYHDGETPITPWLECLRNDGTGTAPTDLDVRAEVSARTTVPALLTDGAPPLAAPVAQAAGVGTSAWTIPSPNTPVSYKIDSGAALTPAFAGDLMMRVAVGTPSISVIVDPVINT
jgi:hypothetical protein